MIQQSRFPAGGLELRNAEFVKSILPDYLRKAAGLPYRKTDTLHDLRHSTLEDLAREIAPATRSVNSSDFAIAMSDSLTAIIADSWTDISARLNPFCRVHELRNFHPTEIHKFDFPDFNEPGEPIEDSVEFCNYSTPKISSTATAQLKTYESAVRVSKELWTTFGGELVTATMRHAYSIGKLELALLSQLLNSNPALADSDNLFNASNSTSSALDINSLDLALSWLASGSPQSLTPSGLLIALGKEATARLLLKSIAGMDTLPILASPELTAGSWFLFSNPTEHASILRLRELNANPNPQIGWIRIPKTESRGYSVIHSVGFSAVDRNGIFRGGI